jgi:peptidoglycan/xylan/chitin deacetylase (PgdA/CDA1 family)
MTKTGIPILMYHGIVSNGNCIGNAIHVSKGNFEQQMAWLFENKFRVITISKMLQFFQQKEITSKCVVLTFDDGYESLLMNATPILEKYSFSATLFLLTGAVGKKTYGDLNTQNSTFPENDGPLNWGQLKIMEQSGWDIQSHSCNHYIHNIIKNDVLENEMRSSKEEIENNLQKTVTFYSYPCGSYNTRCLQMLKATGYEAAFSVHPGMATRNSDVRRLPRIGIDRFTDLESFKIKVETGYGGKLSQLKSYIKYTVYRNTKLKDALKRIYDLRK